MGDFNLALVIVAIVVCIIVFLFNVYLLVNYQHPDDVNQAYFPKFVVVFGLSIAAISILMLPADVANRQACRHAIYNGACNLTLPMKTLWLAIYIVDAVLVFFVIPFAMFYYEGDQDKSIGKRIKSALLWMVTTAIVCALILGILYGLIGKVDFTVRHLSSSTTSFPSSWGDLNSGQQCIGGSGVHQCSAYSASPSSEKTWTMRATFPEYVVALATIVGSVLFAIFGGVGIACLPLGLIFSFIRRPKAVITRSQYIKEATELGKKAKELKKAAESLRQEERSGSKGRKFRKNVKEVEKELFQLEEDVKLLEEMYPQGEKAETSWALTVLGYLAKLVLGILGLIVSVAWVAHIIIYLLVDPPLSPFLNEVFIKLDNVWGLLGTAAFAFFCFYLLLAVIAGAMMLGLRLVFITIHPMKWGGTLMNSFLFNVGLILLCSISVIQFCSTAFAYYAQATAAQEIFGHTLESLRGIKYLYKYNVFQIAFVVLAGLTFVYYAAFVIAMTMILGVYGSRNHVLGPESSLVFQPSPLFVQYVKVENLESKPGPMLYGSYTYPPPDMVTTWAQTLNVAILSNSHKAKVEGLTEWLEHPTYPNTTLSWNVIHGTGIITQEIFKSSSYYVALGSFNEEEAESTSNDDWFVKLSYGPRWVTYIIGIVGVTLLMFWCFNFLSKFRYAHEDRGVRYEEPAPQRDHLLSSSGSSYDSMSQGDEDLDFTIDGMSLGDDEASNNSRRLCAICFDAPRECFFLPCGHCVACFACGTRIAEASGTCPVCRRNMKKVRKIFTA
ncbi:hypothetical protein TanjilG_10343 [Lupinus angustifolius]|uniref:RING-type domain-containing protein n=1 Tax=Lupinus angustifolius TaxID=3871 RepID=A0A4P1R4U9_LUPAN|nr:hypothetical protein TanjilG_10343 [Lupinus angustifolius]